MHYTASCKHSLVLLKMGEIIARNMLSWLELLLTVIIASSWLSILFVSVMYGQTNIRYGMDWWMNGWMNEWQSNIAQDLNMMLLLHRTLQTNFILYGYLTPSCINISGRTFQLMRPNRVPALAVMWRQLIFMSYNSEQVYSMIHTDLRK